MTGPIYTPLPRLQSADRAGVQKILCGLNIDRPLVPQVLKHLDCPEADFVKCWIDVFFTFRCLARREMNSFIQFPAEEGSLTEVPVRSSDVWIGVEEYYASFERAFPSVSPTEFVGYVFATRPEVALAFWKVFQDFSQPSSPEGENRG